MRLFVYHMRGKIIEGFVKLWYFVAFKLLIFSSRLCPLLENVSPVVRTSFCVLFSLVFLSSSINSYSVSTKREAIATENFNQQQILAITSLLSKRSSNHALLITTKCPRD